MMDLSVVSEMITKLNDAVIMGENVNVLMFLDGKTFLDGNVVAERITIEENSINILQGGFDITFYFEDSEITVEDDDIFTISKSSLEVSFIF